MNLFLLLLGGSCGAAARHGLGVFIMKREKHDFPLGTLLINLAGCLLLGGISSLQPGKNVSLLLCDGFCGAFTTFSTFSLESVRLVRGHARKKAAAYVILSVVCGAVLFAAGYAAAALRGQ